MASPPYRFKKFLVEQTGVAHPVGTDSVLLGAWADVERAQSILDIGTGTGVVALMLAQRAPESRVTAVEIHPESAACAGRNFAASPWPERLELFVGSAQDFSASGQRFDLVVSNPPFFSETIVSPNETRRLGRHIATLPPGQLLTAAQRLLAPGGRFCAILPEKEGRLFCELAALQGLYFTKITEVRTRRTKPVERLLLEFRREPFGFEKSELVVYESGEVYSEAFWALTKSFYLK